MNENYDILFERYKSGIDADNPPKLLLHACCAPCSRATLERLADHFVVALL